MIRPTNYIGYHVGDIDDEYIASSEHTDWAGIYKNSNKLPDIVGNEPTQYQAFVYEYEYDYETNNIQRTIIEYGTKEDMWNLERDLHYKNDVDINEKYFNLKKSGGAYKTIKVDDLEELRKRILSGEFTNAKPESIEDLYNELIPKRLQNRTSEDVKAVRIITKDIKGEESTKYCEPIRVKINKDGTRTMFDGNTTLMAAYAAKNSLSNPILFVDEIPYDISQHYSNDEFDELGVLMNKKPKVTKRHATPEDVALRVYKRFINNQTPIKDKKNKEYIELAGYRPTDIYAICNSWFNKGGPVGTYINYGLEHNKPILEKAIRGYTTSDTHVLSFSSGKLREAALIRWLAKNTNFGSKKPEKTKLAIVIYHPNSVAEDKWDKEYVDRKKEIKYICIKCGVEFIGFRIMDTH